VGSDHMVIEDYVVAFVCTIFVAYVGILAYICWW
jgi:hypothetical protein